MFTRYFHRDEDLLEVERKLRAEPVELGFFNRVGLDAVLMLAVAPECGFCEEEPTAEPVF